MRIGKGWWAYLPGGPKLGKRWWGKGPAQVIWENSCRTTKPNFRRSTLELWRSHIKAELGEFVQTDKKEQT
jgi:hypothetical protein